MNIVSPVGLGSSGRSTALGPALYQTSRAAQSANITAADNSGSLAAGTTSAVTQIHAAVSQMLRSVGGGVENDKMLQMLIALLILLTLLEQSQSQDTAARDALAQLGTRRDSQTQFISGYASSTTMTFEYTSTTVFFGSTDAYSMDASGQPLPEGGEVDTRA